MEKNQNQANKKTKEMIAFKRNILKAINNYKKMYRNTDGLLIQTFDKKVFENKNQKEIQKEIHAILFKEYSIVLENSLIFFDENSAIIVGYANKIIFMRKKDAEKLC